MRPLIASLLASAVAVAALSCSGKPARPGSPSAPEDIAKHEVLPFVGSFQVHRFALDNGMRLLVVEDHRSPTFAYQTFFRVGSRNEAKGRTGLAHLFEHMMFKETKNLKDGEFDRTLESAGVEGENAYTSWDHTVYVQELPKTQLDLVARLEAERMVNLVVNDASFKTETEVVQNERRYRYENNPDGVLFQELMGLAFTTHPYHWPVIGYQEDLAAMSAEDARAFYRAYYSPNHATVVVVGDVVPSEVLATVEKHYGGLAAQPAPDAAIAAEPEQVSPRRKALRLNMQIEKLLIGYHIPNALHPDYAAMYLLESVVAGGKSSRLHRALVETGIASSVESYALDGKDPQLFVVGANMQSGKRAAQAESAVLRELARLAREPVPAAELERAKNRASFKFYDDLESNSEKARFLGQWEDLAGDFRAGLGLFERVRKLGPADIQAAAKKVFDPKGRTVVTGVMK
jgi:zinc protease